MMGYDTLGGDDGGVIPRLCEGKNHDYYYCHRLGLGVGVMIVNDSHRVVMIVIRCLLLLSPTIIFTHYFGGSPSGHSLCNNHPLLLVSLLMLKPYLDFFIDIYFFDATTHC
jgi:hypothetical protein